jgi:hypothetical protein
VLSADFQVQRYEGSGDCHAFSLLLCADTPLFLIYLKNMRDVACVKNKVKSGAFWRKFRTFASSKQNNRKTIWQNKKDH